MWSVCTLFQRVSGKNYGLGDTFGWVFMTFWQINKLFDTGVHVRSPQRNFVPEISFVLPRGGHYEGHYEEWPSDLGWHNNPLAPKYTTFLKTEFTLSPWKWR